MMKLSKKIKLMNCHISYEQLVLPRIIANKLIRKLSGTLHEIYMTPETFQAA